jgi:hypothetical protein
MYKSSAITLIYKFLLILSLIIPWVLIIINVKSVTSSDFNFFLCAIIFYVWLFILLLILVIRLRNISANEDFLIIDQLALEIKVDYKDVIHIYQIPLIPLVLLKYFDNEKNKFKKIIIIPSGVWIFPLFYMFKEGKMTRYIKSKIKERNIDYEDNKKIKWISFSYIFGTGIIINIICNILLKV